MIQRKQRRARHAAWTVQDVAGGAVGVTRPAFFPFFSTLLVMSIACAPSQVLNWKPLAPLPDATGFAGSFAGVSGEALIVAGGANFPGAMPWEGGRKVWHDSIFVLPRADGQWLSGFKLPRPAAYGVSITTSDGVLCAGGSDAREHFHDVFLLRWANGRIQSEPLPPLPRPMANGCGALLGRTVYLAGGTEKPDATNALRVFWALDLSELRPRWRELEPWPGPARMLAVAGGGAASRLSPAGIDESETGATPVMRGKDAFFLFSGVDLSGDANGRPVRRYLKDAYRFAPGKGWNRIADLPRAVVAAPSPAVEHHGRLLVFSGDDGELVNFEPKSAHPGFPKSVLAYDPRANKWTSLAESPLSRATAPVVKWQDMAVIPSGEARPGVRSPEVWAVHPAVR